MEAMCPRCASHRSSSLTKRHSRVIAGVTFTATLPAWRCLDCGHVCIDRHVFASFDRAVAVDIAQRGPTTGETFRFLRERLTHSSEELASILEVDPFVLRVWEDEATKVERVAWLVVAGLVLESLDAGASTSVKVPGSSASIRTAVEIRLPWDDGATSAAS